jgi:hypothetical protein
MFCRGTALPLTVTFTYLYIIMTDIFIFLLHLAGVFFLARYHSHTLSILDQTLFTFTQTEADTISNYKKGSKVRLIQIILRAILMFLIELMK